MDQTEPMRYFGRQRDWKPVDLSELWHHREVIGRLALRDLKVRYRQTLVGVAWAVLQPLAMMLIFWTLVRSMGAKASLASISYPLIALAGLIPWQLFATSLQMSAHSITMNRHLVTKVYFPRAALPLASLCVGMVDFLCASLLLVGAMLWHATVPGWTVFAFPLFVLLAALAALGAGVWLSALNALYRDIEFALPFVLQIGLFASPVLYESSAVVSERIRPFYALNPMVGVIEGMRWSLFGDRPFPVLEVSISAVVSVVLLYTGAVYFRRMERVISDQV